MKGRIVPQTLPWPIRWKVDFDYLTSLSAKDLTWLSKFVAAHYDGDFRTLDKRVWTRKRRRETWQAKKSARSSTLPGSLFRDLLLLPGETPHAFIEEPSAELAERAPDFSYLETQGYKEARDNFRKDPSDENRRVLELCSGRSELSDAESWALRDLEAWTKKSCP